MNRTMSTLVALTNLRKMYGARRALDGLSLCVEEGEVLGLLGPNGAGKSTTMGIIAGLCAADAGDVRLFGNRSPRDPKARALLGFAPQELALYRELTAEENLRF